LLSGCAIPRRRGSPAGLGLQLALRDAASGLPALPIQLSSRCATVAITLPPRWLSNPFANHCQLTRLGLPGTQGWTRHSLATWLRRSEPRRLRRCCNCTSSRCRCTPRGRAIRRCRRRRHSSTAACPLSVRWRCTSSCRRTRQPRRSGRASSTKPSSRRSCSISRRQLTKKPSKQAGAFPAASAQAKERRRRDPRGLGPLLLIRGNETFVHDSAGEKASGALIRRGRATDAMHVHRMVRLVVQCTPRCVCCVPRRAAKESC
jgi:hypothetical protein